MATTRLTGEAAMGISHSPCWSPPKESAENEKVT